MATSGREEPSELLRKVRERMERLNEIPSDLYYTPEEHQQRMRQLFGRPQVHRFPTEPQQSKTKLASISSHPLPPNGEYFRHYGRIEGIKPKETGNDEANWPS